ncbi:HlyD family efflux transporter periplasmic adaptor subunit [Actinoplanes sp. NEAU-A12]|uniref:HlyD family efflux transporter periplasmic adaptor subunit n=1 Tax=Actinoplanes sandaracinus TaxID=3045177 RepID=A0ABT6WK05_9ACTN|nr:HlyD family efflux transporter periplasmic adaptor subunit [Actinoplanes sandaracinus]MDI6100021.1 HlyD family efflux transporter periplasmic adaptor subunit [Actinoplanes sandaracinus]
MYRARSRAVIIAAGVLLLALTGASCDDETSPVRLGNAEIGTVGEIVEAPGTVTARTAATLTAPAAGTLRDLRVEPGQRVREGDVLAVIDAPELTRRRDAAQEALDKSPSGGGVSAGGTAEFTAVRKRTDRQAADAFEQARAAAGEIADPQVRKALTDQVDAAEASYETASAASAAALRSVQRGVASLGRAMGALSAAQRLQAKQAYELADAAVDALTLRAPVAGVVQLGGPAQAGGGSLAGLLPPASGGGAGASGSSGVDAAVPEGGYVAPGTPVVTVVDTARLGLVAEVDETDVLLIKEGVAADVELDAAPGAVYPATVTAIDLLPTTSARGGVSYKVRLELAAGNYPDSGEDAPTPRPGMSAVTRLKVRQASGAVTVPASAVVSTDGKDAVWTVRDGRFAAVPVRLGVQGEDTVQIVSGVRAGERVVVAGADQVTAGGEAP